MVSLYFYYFFSILKIFFDKITLFYFLIQHLKGLFFLIFIKKRGYNVKFFIFVGTLNKRIMFDISSRVNAIIVDKLGVDENEVVPSASFTNDLGADSLDTVELIMEFEREFDIQIPDDQAEKIATVGQAVQYIESSK